MSYVCLIRKNQEYSIFIFIIASNVHLTYFKEPELNDLMTVLVQIQSQWSTLGSVLNVPDEMLSANLQSVPNDVKLKVTFLHSLCQE